MAKDYTPLDDVDRLRRRGPRLPPNVRDTEITAEQFKKALGRRLRDLMLDRDLSKAELARRTGLPRDTIGTTVNGTKMPMDRTLAKIASALGVGVDDLLRDLPRLAPSPIVAANDPIPSAGYQVTALDAQRARLVIDRIVPRTVSTQIVAILDELDLGAANAN